MADPWKQPNNKSKYWQNMLRKYEQRNARLQSEECELRHKLEALECSLPIMLCMNVMSQGQPISAPINNSEIPIRDAKSPQVTISNTPYCSCTNCSKAAAGECDCGPSASKPSQPNENQRPKSSGSASAPTIQPNLDKKCNSNTDQTSSSHGQVSNIPQRIEQRDEVPERVPQQTVSLPAKFSNEFCPCEDCALLPIGQCDCGVESSNAFCPCENCELLAQGVCDCGPQNDNVNFQNVPKSGGAATTSKPAVNKKKPYKACDCTLKKTSQSKSPPIAPKPKWGFPSDEQEINITNPLQQGTEGLHSTPYNQGPMTSVQANQFNEPPPSTTVPSVAYPKSGKYAAPYPRSTQDSKYLKPLNQPDSHQYHSRDLPHGFSNDNCDCRKCKLMSSAECECSPQSKSTNPPSSLQPQYRNEDLSLLDSEDFLIIEKVKHLAEKEKSLKQNINELYHKENAINETIETIHFLKGNPIMNNNGNIPFEDNQGNIMENLQRLNDSLLQENSRISDELADGKLDMKQMKERVEGPMQRELEREKRKSKNMEDDLTRAKEEKNRSEDTLKKEIEFLKMQVEATAAQNTDVKALNGRLKDELNLMDTKCNELHQDLINQKISEANTLSRMKAGAAASAPLATYNQTTTPTGAFDQSTIKPALLPTSLQEGIPFSQPTLQQPDALVSLSPSPPNSTNTNTSTTLPQPLLAPKPVSTTLPAFSTTEPLAVLLPSELPTTQVENMPLAVKDERPTTNVEHPMPSVEKTEQLHEGSPIALKILDQNAPLDTPGPQDEMETAAPDLLSKDIPSQQDHIVNIVLIQQETPDLGKVSKMYASGEKNDLIKPILMETSAIDDINISQIGSTTKEVKPIKITTKPTKARDKVRQGSSLNALARDLSDLLKENEDNVNIPKDMKDTAYEIKVLVDVVDKKLTKPRSFSNSTNTKPTTELFKRNLTNKSSEELPQENQEIQGKKKCPCLETALSLITKKLDEKWKSKAPSNADDNTKDFVKRGLPPKQLEDEATEDTEFEDAMDEIPKIKKEMDNDESNVEDLEEETFISNLDLPQNDTTEEDLDNTRPLGKELTENVVYEEQIAEPVRKVEKDIESAENITNTDVYDSKSISETPKPVTLKNDTNGNNKQDINDSIIPQSINIENLEEGKPSCKLKKTEPTKFEPRNINIKPTIDPAALLAAGIKTCECSPNRDVALTTKLHGPGKVLKKLGPSNDIDIETELEADDDVDVNTEVMIVKKKMNGINMTTTLTKSGTLEVITEGPAGIIETTMTLTESGNIEVVTEITDFDEDHDKDDVEDEENTTTDTETDPSSRKDDYHDDDNDRDDHETKPGGGRGGIGADPSDNSKIRKGRSKESNNKPSTESSPGNSNPYNKFHHAAVINPHFSEKTILKKSSIHKRQLNKIKQEKLNILHNTIDKTESTSIRLPSSVLSRSHMIVIDQNAFVLDQLTKILDSNKINISRDNSISDKISNECAIYEEFKSGKINTTLIPRNLNKEERKNMLSSIRNSVALDVTKPSESNDFNDGSVDSDCKRIFCADSNHSLENSKDKLNLVESKSSTAIAICATQCYTDIKRKREMEEIINSDKIERNTDFSMVYTQIESLYNIALRFSNIMKEKSPSPSREIKLRNRSSIAKAKIVKLDTNSARRVHKCINKFTQLSRTVIKERSISDRHLKLKLEKQCTKARGDKANILNKKDLKDCKYESNLSDLFSENYSKVLYLNSIKPPKEIHVAVVTEPWSKVKLTEKDVQRLNIRTLFQSSSSIENLIKQYSCSEKNKRQPCCNDLTRTYAAALQNRNTLYKIEKTGKSRELIDSKQIKETIPTKPKKKKDNKKKLSSTFKNTNAVTNIVLDEGLKSTVGANEINKVSKVEKIVELPHGDSFIENILSDPIKSKKYDDEQNIMLVKNKLRASSFDKVGRMEEDILAVNDVSSMDAMKPEDDSLITEDNKNSNLKLRSSQNKLKKTSELVKKDIKRKNTDFDDKESIEKSNTIMEAKTQNEIKSNTTSTEVLNNTKTVNDFKSENNKSPVSPEILAKIIEENPSNVVPKISVDKVKIVVTPEIIDKTKPEKVFDVTSNPVFTATKDINAHSSDVNIKTNSNIPSEPKLNESKLNVEPVVEVESKVKVELKSDPKLAGPIKSDIVSAVQNENTQHENSNLLLDAKDNPSKSAKPIIEIVVEAEKSKRSSIKVENKSIKSDPQIELNSVSDQVPDMPDIILEVLHECVTLLPIDSEKNAATENKDIEENVITKDRLSEAPDLTLKEEDISETSEHKMNTEKISKLIDAIQKQEDKEDDEIDEQRIMDEIISNTFDIILEKEGMKEMDEQKIEECNIPKVDTNAERKGEKDGLLCTCDVCNCPSETDYQKSEQHCICIKCNCEPIEADTNDSDKCDCKPELCRCIDIEIDRPFNVVQVDKSTVSSNGQYVECFCAHCQCTDTDRIATNAETNEKIYERDTGCVCKPEHCKCTDANNRQELKVDNNASECICKVGYCNCKIIEDIRCSCMSGHCECASDSIRIENYGDMSKDEGCTCKVCVCSTENFNPSELKISSSRDTDISAKCICAKCICTDDTNEKNVTDSSYVQRDPKTHTNGLNCSCNLCNCTPSEVQQRKFEKIHCTCKECNCLLKKTHSFATDTKSDTFEKYKNSASIDGDQTLLIEINNRQIAECVCSLNACICSSQQQMNSGTLNIKKENDQKCTCEPCLFTQNKKYNTSAKGTSAGNKQTSLDQSFAEEIITAVIEPCTCAPFDCNCRPIEIAEQPKVLQECTCKPFLCSCDVPNNNVECTCDPFNCLCEEQSTITVECEPNNCSCRRPNKSQLDNKSISTKSSEYVDCICMDCLCKSDVDNLEVKEVIKEIIAKVLVNDESVNNNCSCSKCECLIEQISNIPEEIKDCVCVPLSCFCDNKSQDKSKECTCDPGNCLCENDNSVINKKHNSTSSKNSSLQKDQDREVNSISVKSSEYLDCNCTVCSCMPDLDNIAATCTCETCICSIKEETNDAFNGPRRNKQTINENDCICTNCECPAESNEDYVHDIAKECTCDPGNCLCENDNPVISKKHSSTSSKNSNLQKDQDREVNSISVKSSEYADCNCTVCSCIPDLDNIAATCTCETCICSIKEETSDAFNGPRRNKQTMDENDCICTNCECPAESNEDYVHDIAKECTCDPGNCLCENDNPVISKKHSSTSSKNSNLQKDQDREVNSISVKSSEYVDCNCTVCSCIPDLDNIAATCTCETCICSIKEETSDAFNGPRQNKQTINENDCICTNCECPAESNEDYVHDIAKECTCNPGNCLCENDNPVISKKHSSTSSKNSNLQKDQDREVNSISVKSSEYVDCDCTVCSCIPDLDNIAATCTCETCICSIKEETSDAFNGPRRNKQTMNENDCICTNCECPAESNEDYVHDIAKECTCDPGNCLCENDNPVISKKHSSTSSKNSNLQKDQDREVNSISVKSSEYVDCNCTVCSCIPDLHNIAATCTCETCICMDCLCKSDVDNLEVKEVIKEIIAKVLVNDESVNNNCSCSKCECPIEQISNIPEEIKDCVCVPLSCFCDNNSQDKSKECTCDPGNCLCENDNPVISKKHSSTSSKNINLQKDQDREVNSIRVKSSEYVDCNCTVCSCIPDLDNIAATCTCETCICSIKEETSDAFNGPRRNKQTMNENDCICANCECPAESNEDYVHDIAKECTCDPSHCLCEEQSINTIECTCDPYNCFCEDHDRTKYKSSKDKRNQDTTKSSPIQKDKLSDVNSISRTRNDTQADTERISLESNKTEQNSTKLNIQLDFEELPNSAKSGKLVELVNNSSLKLLLSKYVHDSIIINLKEDMIQANQDVLEIIEEANRKVTMVLQRIDKRVQDKLRNVNCCKGKRSRIPVYKESSQYSHVGVEEYIGDVMFDNNSKNTHDNYMLSEYTSAVSTFCAENISTHIYKAQNQRGSQSYESSNITLRPNISSNGTFVVDNRECRKLMQNRENYNTLSDCHGFNSEFGIPFVNSTIREQASSLKIDRLDLDVSNTQINARECDNKNLNIMSNESMVSKLEINKEISGITAGVKKVFVRTDENFEEYAKQEYSNINLFPSFSNKYVPKKLSKNKKYPAGDIDDSSRIKLSVSHINAETFFENEKLLINSNCNQLYAENVYKYCRGDIDHVIVKENINHKLEVDKNIDLKQYKQIFEIGKQLDLNTDKMLENSEQYVKNYAQILYKERSDTISEKRNYPDNLEQEKMLLMDNQVNNQYKLNKQKSAVILETSKGEDHHNKSRNDIRMCIIESDGSKIRNISYNVQNTSKNEIVNSSNYITFNDGQANISNGHFQYKVNNFDSRSINSDERSEEIIAYIPKLTNRSCNGSVSRIIIRKIQKKNSWFMYPIKLSDVKCIYTKRNDIIAASKINSKENIIATSHHLVSRENIVSCKSEVITSFINYLSDQRSDTILTSSDQLLSPLNITPNPSNNIIHILGELIKVKQNQYSSYITEQSSTRQNANDSKDVLKCNPQTRISNFHHVPVSSTIDECRVIAERSPICNYSKLDQIDKHGDGDDETDDEWEDALEIIPKTYQTADIVEDTVHRNSIKLVDAKAQTSNVGLNINYCGDIEANHGYSCECIDCLTAPCSKAFATIRSIAEPILECPLCNRIECIGGCKTTHKPVTHQSTQDEDSITVTKAILGVTQSDKVYNQCLLGNCTLNLGDGLVENKDFRSLPCVMNRVIRSNGSTKLLESPCRVWSNEGDALSFDRYQSIPVRDLYISDVTDINKYDDDLNELQNIMKQISSACLKAGSRIPIPLVYYQNPSNPTSVTSLQIALKNLQAKCHNKDSLMKAMICELQMRVSREFSVPEEFSEIIAQNYNIDMKNIELKECSGSNINQNTNHNSYENLVLRKEYNSHSSTIRSCSNGCSCLSCTQTTSEGLRSNCPSEEVINAKSLQMIEVKRIGDDSLLVKWKAPLNDRILGYEVCVDEEVKTRVYRRTRTMAVISAVPLDRKPIVNISVYACTDKGRCLPAALASFHI